MWPILNIYVTNGLEAQSHRQRMEVRDDTDKLTLDFSLFMGFGDNSYNINAGLNL